MDIINLEGGGFSPQSPSPGSAPVTSCLSALLVLQLSNSSHIMYELDRGAYNIEFIIRFQSRMAHMYINALPWVFISKLCNYG